VLSKRIAVMVDAALGDVARSICPLCKLPFQVDDRWSGWWEGHVRVHTCERCHAALMNIILLQKLEQYRKGDPRKLLREELAQHDSEVQ